MKEHKVLKVLDKIKSLYIAMGVDYEQMRLILKYKLTMDKRRNSTLMDVKESESKEKNYFFISLLMYAFLGLFIGLTTFMEMNKMYVYTMIFSLFMFLVLTVFIADFSTVLLDVKDSNVIRVRGVNSKTLNAAKVTHIIYYVFMISIAFAWLAIIGAFFNGILIGLIFIVEIIVVDIFMIVITALVYYLILKYFNGEKVKDIINFVQIILTLTMVVGYQFIPRIFEFADMSILYQDKLWNLLVPPMWFAAPIYAVSEGKISIILLLLIVAAIFIPLIAMVIYSNKTKQFENYLSKLNANDGKEKEKKRGLLYKIGYMFCHDNEEKAIYSFASSLIKNERDFKLKVYPNLGFSVVMPFLFMFIIGDTHNMSNFSQWKSEISNSNSYLYIYFFVLMLSNILVLLQYSNNYKASWVYISTPIKNKINIYKGCYKAVFASLILPLYLLEAIIFIWLFGIKVIPHLIVILLFILLMIPLEHFISKFDLPFSGKFSATNSSQGVIIMFLSFGIVGIGSLIHFLLSKIIFGAIIYIMVLIILNIIMWNKGIVVKKSAINKN